MATIQDQYRGTNVETLIKGIIEIRTKHRNTALEALKTEVMDLRTASGDALDLWGRLLGFPRYIPIGTSEDAEVFQNFTFYDRNFYKLKFYDASDLVYVKLTDDAYRKVLKIIYYNNSTYSNIYNASELATDIFESDITVGDSMTMEYVTYYLKEEIDTWLIWILDNYDILPRPVCVGTRYATIIWKIFHFMTESAEYNKKLTAFYNAQFLGDRDWNDALGETPIEPDFPEEESIYTTDGGVAFSFGWNFYNATFSADDIADDVILAGETSNTYGFETDDSIYNSTSSAFYKAQFKE